MLKKYGRGMAVLLAVSLTAASLPAAAAVPSDETEKEGTVLQTDRKSTPSEWEEPETEDPEEGSENELETVPEKKPETDPEKEQEYEASLLAEDEKATDSEMPENGAPDPTAVPTGTTEWSFEGTAGIVKQTMEGPGSCGECGGLYINAEKGKAAPRDDKFRDHSLHSCGGSI